MNETTIAKQDSGMTPVAAAADTNTTIKYGAQSTLSRWREHYWTERYMGMTSWLAVGVLITFLLFGPQLILSLASFLPLDQLGNSGASVRAHQTILLLATLLSILPAVMIFRWFAKPQAVEISAAGIRLRWRLGMGGKLVPLAQCHVRMWIPNGKTDLRAYQLQIGSTDQPDQLCLSLGELDEERGGALLEALEKHGSPQYIDTAVYDMLKPKKELSFTEIWLEALAAPPGREKLLPLEPGIVLDGKYAIRQRLGAGGQGTVYLADDLHGKRQVVLKETILPVYASLTQRKKALEEFHKEAVALETVRHSNIVKFLASFVADHRAYLVLEYIPGQTVANLIAENGPLPIAKATRLAIQMCTILSALHQAQIVHRDFTPDNLIFDQSGRLVLIDFAVAVGNEEESLEIAGKSAYMAPEQFKGKPCLQSDMYSLGATLHYMLTGQHPAPLSESWPMLENDNVPRELNDIVATATRYDAASRFEHIDRMRCALESVAEKPESSP